MSQTEPVTILIRSLRNLGTKIRISRESSRPDREGAVSVSPTELLMSQEVPVFNDLDFDYAQLNQLAIIGARFVDCSFRHANFSGSDLSQTRFINCDLYNTTFLDSVLYTTWFHNTNLTKANFAGASLLGFRAKDVDITKAIFDKVPLVGYERKPLNTAPDSYSRVSIGEKLPAKATDLERQIPGLHCLQSGETLTFIPVNPRKDRRYHLRVAETAKYLKQVHLENFYTEQADEYHVVERRSRRHARASKPAGRVGALLEYVFADLGWRYGTSIARPVAAFLTTALIATLIVISLPYIDSESGFIPNGSSNPVTFSGLPKTKIDTIASVYYQFLTIPIGISIGSLNGWARVVLLVFMANTLTLVGLVLEAVFRRLGH